MVIMAKNTNKVTVNEKTLEKLITMCQVQSKMLEIMHTKCNNKGTRLMY
jgi:hypothetical protein